MAEPSLTTNRTASSETLPNSPLPHPADCQIENCYYHRHSKNGTSKDECDDHYLTGTTANHSTSATLTNHDEDLGINQPRPPSANHRNENRVSGASYRTGLQEHTSAAVEKDHGQSIVEITIRTVGSFFELNDPADPRHWNKGKKLGVSAFVLLSGFVATFGTPIYISAAPYVLNLFQTSPTVAILPASMYAFGIGIGALLCSAISEVFGRTIIYKITTPLCLLFICVGGSSENIISIIFARFLAGVFAGPWLTVGSGSLNDIFDISLELMGTAIAVLFVLAIIWATQIGPMVSATVVARSESWRWTFWTHAILVSLVVIGAFMVPETYAPQIKRRRARKAGQQVQKRNLIESCWTSVRRPVHMLIVEPILFPSALLLAITQAVVFSYYVTYGVLFETTYGFTPYQVGMAFAPMILGSLLAVPTIGIIDRVTYQPARVAAIKSGGVVAPEKRLFSAMLGCLALPTSLLWLAWSGRKGNHWILPCSSGALFGFSYVLNMLCIPLYANDIYTTRYGASVLAGSTFTRFTISACFPLFTIQMINKLGLQWALTLLAFLSMLLIPVPFIFYRCGPRLRARSTYIPPMPDLPLTVQLAVPRNTLSTALPRPLSVVMAGNLPPGGEQERQREGVLAGVRNSMLV